MPTRRRVIQAVIAAGTVSIAGCSELGSEAGDEPGMSKVFMSDFETVPSEEGPNGQAGVRVTMTNMHENVTVTRASFRFVGRHKDDSDEEVYNVTREIDTTLEPYEHSTLFIPLSERYHDQLGPESWSPLTWEYSLDTPS